MVSCFKLLKSILLGPHMINSSSEGVSSYISLRGMIDAKPSLSSFIWFLILSGKELILLYRTDFHRRKIVIYRGTLRLVDTSPKTGHPLIVDGFVKRKRKRRKEILFYKGYTPHIRIPHLMDSDFHSQIRNVRYHR